MKKTVIFVILLLSAPIIILVDNYYRNSNYSNYTKDKKWEFLKERVFRDNPMVINDEVKVFKFTGPILVSLVNASQKDSVAVDLVLNNLKQLLPNKKVDYFETYTGIALGNPKKKSANDTLRINTYKFEHLKKFAIRLSFKDTINNPNHIYKLKEPSGFSYVATSDKDVYFSGIEHVNLKYVFNSNASIEKRRAQIQLYLVRTIAMASHFDLGDKKVVNDENSILNDVKDISSLELSEYDQFLLQKLYSPNLHQEYTHYIENSYPWYYENASSDESEISPIGLIIVMIFVCLLIIQGFSVLYGRTYKSTYLHYLVPWSVLFISLYSIILVGKFFFGTGISDMKLMLTGYFLVFLSAVYVSFLLMLSDKIIDKYVSEFWLSVALKVIVTFLVFISPFLFNNISNVKINFKINGSDGLQGFATFFTICRTLFLFVNFYTDNLIKQKDLELSELKTLKSQAEVKLLQSQINPHFLYNSLNSIASLAHKDAAKTEKMALSLSDLFKYTINRKGKKSSTIGDEVDMVKNYLEVEHIRFGDRLSYQVDVDKALDDIEIPMFLIQPLIENAVKHGISEREDTGAIHLKISKDNSDIIISVKDNGPHFPETLVSGHGLQTVYDLLKLTYGDNATVNMQNAPEKNISITIKNIA